MAGNCKINTTRFTLEAWKEFTWRYGNVYKGSDICVEGCLLRQVCLDVSLSLSPLLPVTTISPSHLLVSLSLSLSSVWSFSSIFSSFFPLFLFLLLLSLPSSFSPLHMSLLPKLMTPYFLSLSLPRLFTHPLCFPSIRSHLFHRQSFPPTPFTPLHWLLSTPHPPRIHFLSLQHRITPYTFFLLHLFSLFSPLIALPSSSSHPPSPLSLFFEPPSWSPQIWLNDVMIIKCKQTLMTSHENPPTSRFLLRWTIFFCFLRGSNYEMYIFTDFFAIKDSYCVYVVIMGFKIVF